MKWAIILIGVFGIIALSLKAAMDTGEKSPKFVGGHIHLPENLLEKSRGMSTLFVVIYDLDSKMPMPYGAVKFRLKEPPKAGNFYPFVITRERLQIMAGETAPAPKRMRVKARLDKDGIAGMDQPGDLTGEIKEVAFGADNVEIRLARLVGS